MGPLQGRGRRRHRRTARFPATACRPTSRAAPATTPRGSTASGPTTTSRTWTGSSRKFETARKHVPKPVVDDGRRARRSASSATARRTGRSRESRDQLREETDVKTSYFRLRAYPFTEELAAFIDAHERVYVDRAEPRRAAAAADAAGADAGAADEAAQRAALQRAADRRPQHHRRRAGAGRLRSGEEDGPRAPARGHAGGE